MGHVTLRSSLKMERSIPLVIGGQLGHGDFQNKLVPTLINAPFEGKKIEQEVGYGWSHSMALISEGVLFMSSNGNVLDSPQRQTFLGALKRASVGIGVRKVVQGVPIKYDLSLTSDGNIGAFFRFVGIGMYDSRSVCKENCTIGQKLQLGKRHLATRT